jgi:hypothetical protein
MYFPDRETRRVVLLRDPISLHLSLYNHRMMLHLAKGLRTYSFDLHLKALPRDFVAHRLLARGLEIPWPALMAMTDQQKYTALNLALGPTQSSWPGLARPPTSCGTGPAGFRGCPAQGRARRLCWY